MKDYLEKVLNADQSIKHGVYEPPNNIPILRYNIKKNNYKLVLLNDSDDVLSCMYWLKTENIVPDYTIDDLNELDTLDKNNKYFVIITNSNYKYLSYQKKMIEQFKKNNISDYLCPYDYEKIPKHDSAYLDYFAQNKEKLIEMLSYLSDYNSQEVYIEYIRSKMFCDFYRLEQLPTWEKYFDKKIYTHLEDEKFVNCGSSNGDTIFYFLENFNDFEYIYAIEGDKDRIKQFNDNLIYLPIDVRNKINSINTYIDNNENKIDNILNGERITLLNMDIEGMELEALKSARNTIKKWQPVIAACAYHKPSDLYELPMYIKELSDYEIFYRKYASTVRNRFCNAELVMYAVPKKRLVRNLPI